MSHAFDGIFPIGLGTARFPFATPDTYQADFDRTFACIIIRIIFTGSQRSSRNATRIIKGSGSFRRLTITFLIRSYLWIDRWETGLESGA